MVKEPEKKPRRCPQCKKIKASVRRRPDDYAREINEEPKAMWTACDECDQENRDDI